MLLQGASPTAVAMAKIPEITFDVVSRLSYCDAHTHTRKQEYRINLSLFSLKTSLTGLITGAPLMRLGLCQHKSLFQREFSFHFQATTFQ